MTKWRMTWHSMTWHRCHINSSTYTTYTHHQSLIVELVLAVLFHHVSQSVSREFIQRMKCDTCNALYVLVGLLWKQPSFKQTSETVSAKCRIRQIIAQWVPDSWAGNSKCPTPIRAETVSRHNYVMTPDRTKMSSTGHIRDWNAVVRQVPGSRCD